MQFSSTFSLISAFILEWTPFCLTATYFIFSFFLYIILPSSVRDPLWYLYISIQTFVTLAVVSEAIHSIGPNVKARRERRKAAKEGFPDLPDDKCPHIDVVLVAYLPNEKDIILRQTRYFLREVNYPASKLTINIVYNTPRPIEPVQTQLSEMEAKYPNLRVINVPGSTSKAHNVNYFLSLKDTKGEIISVYDTDHSCEPQALRWVARRFNKGDVDIIQGRCNIYNQINICTKLIGAEFDSIYSVFHPGRAEQQGYGLFGGSNGHWNASLLKTIKFEGHMLTEDIDSTLRAITSGARIVYDLKVLSFETAPETFAALLKQRLRWAQGWTQVSIRHFVPAMKRGAHGSFYRSRIGLFFLLAFREFYFYFLSQLTGLLLSSFLTHVPKSWDELYSSFIGFKISAWILVLNLVCIFIATCITIRNRCEFTSAWSVVAFGVVSPLYFTIVTYTSIFCHFRELIKYEKWNPTARSGPKKPKA